MGVPTCHVLEGEGSRGVAARVTLLVPHPRLVQVFHEAVLVGPGWAGRARGGAQSRRRASWAGPGVGGAALGRAGSGKEPGAAVGASGPRWEALGGGWRRWCSDGRRLAHLRMDRETFCFQGLSLRMPMPKPERKNSSPVVTRSHFCEASNSSTAESQIKACSLLRAGAGVTGAPPLQGRPRSRPLARPRRPPWKTRGLSAPLRPGRSHPPRAAASPGPRPAPPLTCPAQPGWPPPRSRSCASPCAGTWCSAPPAAGSRCPPSSASPSRR